MSALIRLVLPTLGQVAPPIQPKQVDELVQLPIPYVRILWVNPSG
ncbi:MAG: hypothetical protein QW688_09430 [Thermoprotei archaeon]